MRQRGALLALLLAPAFACGTSDASPAPVADAGPSKEAGAGCPQGFVALPDGDGCDAIVPPNDCPAGTRAAIGSADCVSVTPASCPAGFKPDPSKWNCTDVLPAQACAGATMEVLGSTACAPVGDCAAAFPPAGAAVFVKASYADGDLDATHFRAINDAIAAAPSGATIAIDSGTYSETLTPARAVRLVGRCAAQVILKNPGTASPGIDVVVSGVSASGITFQGHKPGIVVEKKGTLELDSVVVDGNRDIGIVVQNAGSTVKLTRSVVRGTLDASGTFGWGMAVELAGSAEIDHSSFSGNHQTGIGVSDTGSIAQISASVVRDTLPDSTGSGDAIHVQGGRAELTACALVANVNEGLSIDGGSAKVTGSIIRDTASGPTGERGDAVVLGPSSTLDMDTTALVRSREVALSLGGAGAVANVTTTAIVDTRPNAKGEFGAAIGVQDGAKLTFKSGVVAKSTYYGAFVAGRGATFEIDDSLVRDTAVLDKLGRGLNVQDGGHLIANDSAVIASGTDGVLFDGQLGPSQADLTRVLVSGARGACAFGRDGGKLTMTESAFIGCTEIGLYLSDTIGSTKSRVSASATSSVIRDIRPLSTGESGAGVVSGGNVELTGTTIMHNHGFGVLVASEGASATLTRLIVRDTIAEVKDNLYGHGVVGLEHSMVTLTDSVLRGNANIGIAFQTATALVSGGVVEGNLIGIHVQGDSSLREVPTAPDSLEPLEIVVTSDTRFVDNQTKVSSEFVPLPSAPVSR